MHGEPAGTFVPVVSSGEQRAITITGTSDEDEGDWPVWVAAPPRPGRYAIDIELLNPQGTVPLATLRSPSFAR
ncbi:hypothetical protein [Baekduia sp.]|uniref:hypothetical protein n=1 Tax=Baekduia sp. TaxID=2600305 RepID=UPI002DF7498C|nr:hypothetical protein [Baekduia sp.]